MNLTVLCVHTNAHTLSYTHTKLRTGNSKDVQYSNCMQKDVTQLEGCGRDWNIQPAHTAPGNCRNYLHTSTKKKKATTQRKLPVPPTDPILIYLNSPA